MTSDDQPPYELEATLGNLTVYVSGPDSEFVREAFEETWENRMEEAEDVSKALREGTRTCQ